MACTWATGRAGRTGTHEEKGRECALRTAGAVLTRTPTPTSESERAARLRLGPLPHAGLSAQGTSSLADHPGHTGSEGHGKGSEAGRKERDEKQSWTRSVPGRTSLALCPDPCALGGLTRSATVALGDISTLKGKQT